MGGHPGRLPLRDTAEAENGYRSYSSQQVAEGRAVVIPSFGAGVVRLLAPFPRRRLRVVLGIIQVVGAITARRFLGAFPKEIGLEFAFFPFELFDHLLQLGDAESGIAMATLRIARLPTLFEVLALETLDYGAQLSHFLA
jgi:hypothetical protein